jgi:DNA-binding IclR family transcriptional regulator
VLLAYGAAPLPPGRLVRRTGRTITSRDALQADLAEVRRRGYAVTNEELEPGLVAVAAPVYRDGAAVVAALSVSGPATRLTARRIPAIAAQCVAEASALSGVLGYQQQQRARGQRKEGAA